MDGRDFVRYWVHNGFVNIDSEKMCAFNKLRVCLFTVRAASTTCNQHKGQTVHQTCRKPALIQARPGRASSGRLMYNAEANTKAEVMQVEIARKLLHNTRCAEAVPCNGVALVPGERAIPPAGQLHGQSASRCHRSLVSHLRDAGKHCATAVRLGCAACTALLQ